jgi:hypothetical protein
VDDYLAIVPDPIDVNTITDRVDSGYYRNFVQFRADIDLMISNTKLFYVKNQKQELNKVCSNCNLFPFYFLFYF